MKEKDSNSKTTRHQGAAPHLEQRSREFLERLYDHGYAESTIGFYRRAIGRFISSMRRMGICAADLGNQDTDELVDRSLDGMARCSRRFACFCSERFRDFLIEVGDSPRREAQPVDDSPKGQLRREFEYYLREQRGLGDATIKRAMGVFEQFMLFRFGDEIGDLNTISSNDIMNFILQAATGGPYRDKALVSTLRNLFKFLFWSKKTNRNLATSIPCVAHARPTQIPRYLNSGEVAQLLEAVRTDDALGRRNYAMLLTLARLGLRAAEVVAIQLEDIDWRAGEVLIRGKGSFHDRMPLPADVGEAMVNYLRHGRKGDSRALFVSSRAPFRPFKDGQIVNYILHKAYDKTGLKPPQKYVGSHVLRHSLATDMLSKGASLEEIGDVLRHRSRMSTTIYARHDVDSLRSLARTWPLEGGAR